MAAPLSLAMSPSTTVVSRKTSMGTWEAEQSWCNACDLGWASWQSRLMDPLR
jgi:hypothetical protein